MKTQTTKGSMINGGPVSNPKKKRLNSRARRKEWGLWAYYMAGGAEKRSRLDRRHFEGPEAVGNNIADNRIDSDRRKVINPKFLHCGRIMNLRKDIRRATERIDEATIEREKYNNLGPGWL